jgi:parvulin-like peptidyl-prolyl isomerase
MSLNKNRTTGAPKASKYSSSGRKFKPRSQREAEVNRLVLIITGVIGGLIAVILAVALLIDGVIVPNQPVAVVNGQNISTREFQNRVRFERWRTGQQIAQIARIYPSLLTQQGSPYASLYQELQFPTQMGQRVLDEMINARLIKQYADANGITVTDEEIDKESFTYFGFDPNPATATITPSPTTTLTPIVSVTPSSTPTQTLTPTAVPTDVATTTPTVAPTLTPTLLPTGIPTSTPELSTRQAEYDQNNKDYLESAATAVGFTQADLRQVFYEQALSKKVQAEIAKKELGTDKPTEEEQINVRHILVKTKEEADDVLKALQSGESFSDLARSVSQDPGSGAQGGELGWQGKGIYVPEFEDAVWAAKVGDIVGPIDTSRNGPNYGFHIIQVTARQVRPLTPDAADQLVAKTFDDWLANLRGEQSTRYS